MKKYIASVTICLGEYTPEEGLRYNKYRSKNKIVDVENPTEKEMKMYFDNYLDQLAGSNDGSEMIANAKPIIVEVGI